MGAVMREAWLWLLVAFVLGVLVGYYLRRYTVGGAEQDLNDAVTEDTDAAGAESTDEPGESKPQGS